MVISARGGRCGCRSCCAGWCRARATRIAGLIAVVGGIAILVNALFMQSGPHPAPIFANKPAPLVAPSFGPVVAMLPKAGDDKTAAAAPARPRGELVTDIQRELTKRGFYEGAADGVYGPKTDAAIRDFEQAAGLRASAEPSEALLAAIAKSNVKAAPAQAVDAQGSDRRAARAEQAPDRDPAGACRFRLWAGPGDRRS